MLHIHEQFDRKIDREVNKGWRKADGKNPWTIIMRTYFFDDGKKAIRKLDKTTIKIYT